MCWHGTCRDTMCITGMVFLVGGPGGNCNGRGYAGMAVAPLASLKRAPQLITWRTTALSHWRSVSKVRRSTPRLQPPLRVGSANTEGENFPAHDDPNPCER